MTSTRTPEPPTDGGLERALKSVTEALAKTDVKAGLLFALDGGLAALLRTALSTGPAAARITAGLASAFLAVSVVFIVLAVLPKLDDERTSFPRWAKLSPEEIREAVEEETRPQQIGILSRLAMLKFRRLIAACIATGLSVLLLIASDNLAGLG
ncbi:Pycsar system effector family protein [Streptomyces abikoensis]